MRRHVAGFILLAVALVPSATAQDGAKSAHDVLIEMPTVLAQESKAAGRVVVYETKGIDQVAPLPGATVEVTIEDRERKSTALYSGKTGRTGAADCSFTVPNLPDGDYTISVKTKSDAGEHLATIAARLQRESRILLVTDKPLYQPGQQIRLRGLAMDAMTLKALGGQDVAYEIEDSKGNKVFRRQVRTDDFGISSVDFRLADEVIMGDYKITAAMGGSAWRSRPTMSTRPLWRSVAP